MKRSQVLRICDANFNRSREGLRVCEEITRFVLNDKKLTAALKSVRHAVSEAIKSFPATWSELAKSRDVRSDVGKAYSALESGRGDVLHLFLANAERVKESLRVLEEISKFIDSRTSEKFKKVRFKVYAIEKRALPKLEALCHSRPRSGKK